MNNWEIETTETGNEAPLGVTIRNNGGQAFFMEEPEAINLGHDDFYYYDDETQDYIKIDYQIIAFVHTDNQQQTEYEWVDFKKFISEDQNATPNCIITIFDVTSGMRVSSNKSKGSISSTEVLFPSAANNPMKG